MTRSLAFSSVLTLSLGQRILTYLRGGGSGIPGDPAIPQQALESSGMGFITLSLEIFLTPGRFARVFQRQKRAERAH